MQTKNVEGYLAPEVEVNHVAVESGIAATQFVDPEENPEAGWD